MAAAALHFRGARRLWKAHSSAFARPRPPSPCSHEGAAQRVSGSRPQALSRSPCTCGTSREQGHAEEAKTWTGGGWPRGARASRNLFSGSRRRRCRCAPGAFPARRAPRQSLSPFWDRLREKKLVPRCAHRGDSTFLTRGSEPRELFASFRAAGVDVSQTG